MGLTVGELVAYIDLDDAKYNSKVDAAGSKFSGLGSKLGSFAKVAGVTVAAGLGVAAAAAYKMIGPMAEMEQNVAKANTVFGDSIGPVEAWAKSTANAMGLTTNQATGLAASFGDLLVPMGFTRTEAAAMSTDVVGLSGALSAWSGGTRSAAEVSQILAKAMLGERDSLKELGISITEADVSARLLANGTADLTGQQLEQAKATATQQLIFEKSADAQAAFADGNKTIGEKMLEVKARMNEVKDSLLTALMPAFSSLLDWVVAHLPQIQATAETVFGAIKTAINFISNTVVPALKTAIDTFKGWFAGAEGGPAIGVVFDAIKTVADGMRALIVDVVWPGIKAAIETFKTFWDDHGASIKAIFDAIRDAASAVVGFIQDNWGTISTVLQTVWNVATIPLGLMLTIFGGILDAIAFVINKIRDNWPEISGKIESVWNTIKVPLGLMKDAFLAVRDAVQWVIDKINLLNSTSVQKKQVDAGLSTAYGGGQYKPATISRGITRALGGPIPGSGPVPITAHGGEYVLTKGDTSLMQELIAAVKGGQTGGGKVLNFNVSGTSGLDQGRQIAAVLATV